MEKNNRSHFWWTIGVLVGIIILVGSALFCKWIPPQNKIIQYLTFASTVLSIVLALFSIIFSYFSSHDVNQKVEEINSALRQFSQLTQETKGVNTNIEKNVQTLANNLDTIKRLSDIVTTFTESAKSISDDVGKLNNTIGSVEELQKDLISTAKQLKDENQSLNEAVKKMTENLNMTNQEPTQNPAAPKFDSSNNNAAALKSETQVQ